MKTPTHIKKRGFTLIEMSVSIAIFTVISGVILYRHSSFSNNILVTNLAYDIALNLRQAQVYGLSSVGKNIGGNQTFKIGYGLHFDMTSEDAKKSFIFFADADSPENRRYDLASNCDDQIDDECIEKIKITGGNKIEKICLEIKNVTELDCTSTDTLDIVFKRPETEATLYINELGNTTDITGAKIYVISPQGRQKIVTVQESGQISIGDPQIVNE